MVKLTIREMAIRRGVTTAYQLQKLAGLYPGHAAKLWSGKSLMIGLSTLDSLCEALNCQPGDLFVRVRGKKAKR